MLTIVIVGVVTLLSKTVTTRLFDTENENYLNSLENYEFNSDVGDGLGWLELEQKASYLANQATYDDDEDYDKYESVRDIPMRINYQKSQYCMERPADIQYSFQNVRFDRSPVNIECVESNVKSNPHSVRCKSERNKPCKTLFHEVRVFRNNKNSECWEPAENITVKTGCRCY